MSSLKAICLLSGGLDSATALGVALKSSYDVSALTVNYGQLHVREIEFATKIAQYFKIEHVIINVPMPWGGSALLDSRIELPKNRDENQMASGIPTSYVPARNTIFLSLAASFAEARDARVIFIGANAIDYSGYPDCRSEFFDAFEEAIRRGTKCGSEGKSLIIDAPLLHMSKPDIIQLGISLGIPYELTWSCYQGGETPCGQCDSCKLRAKGFREARLEDPFILKARA